MPVEAEDEGWESPEDSHLMPAATGDGGDDVRDVIDMGDDAVVQTADAVPEPNLPSKVTGHIDHGVHTA